MSKIVVLVGSVRKGGNTDLLAHAFAESAGKCHEVELISVVDHAVHPCIGCNSCYTSEGHRCFREDDMQRIYEKLKQADVLVIASPVYFYGISAQLSIYRKQPRQLRRYNSHLPPSFFFVLH